MSLPSRGEPRQRHVAATRWAVICSALDDNARAFRLCAIMLVVEIPPGLLVLLLRR